MVGSQMRDLRDSLPGLLTRPLLPSVAALTRGPGTGATAQELARTVLDRCARLVVAGAGLALPGVVPFGASARDPMPFALAFVFPNVVALALCHLSAGQAVPTNPIAAWRHA